MRQATPLHALQTLERELEALCDDAPVAGSMLEQRLDAVLELLVVVGGAARQEPAPDVRERLTRQMSAMHARCESLTSILHARMASVSAELSTLRSGSQAAASYAAPARQAPQYQLNRVG